VTGHVFGTLFRRRRRRRRRRRIGKRRRGRSRISSKSRWPPATKTMKDAHAGSDNPSPLRRCGGGGLVLSTTFPGPPLVGIIPNNAWTKINQRIPETLKGKHSGGQYIHPKEIPLEVVFGMTIIQKELGDGQ